MDSESFSDIFVDIFVLVICFLIGVLINFISKHEKVKKGFELVYKILGYIVLFFVFCLSLLFIINGIIGIICGEDTIEGNIFILVIGIIIGLCGLRYIKSDNDNEFKAE